MEMNIREQTAIIICRDGEYLVGRCIVTGTLRWSDSPWDAWRTRRKDHAFIIADKVGGKRMLFNPVAGQVREMVI